MSTDPRERWEVTFSGHVQGVGFRYRTERLARGHAVAGYVRNLPDGRVELVAEGARADLGAFLEALEQEMSGYIRDRQVRECPPTGEFSGFGIRH